MEILATDEILVGYDTLDSGDDVLVAEARLQFLQVTLQVRRRRDEHQRVVLLHNAVDIVFKLYLADVEVDTGKIGGIMTHTTEILDTVVAAHVPANVVGVTHHDLGYGRCPRAATNYRYSTTVVH